MGGSLTVSRYSDDYYENIDNKLSKLKTNSSEPEKQKVEELEKRIEEYKTYEKE